MELRHLRYFVALAEELHFGRAAEKVFVAQSTLSGQIRTLEERMEAQLFDRTKRNVELTEAGRALLPYARRLLREAERAEEATRRAEQGLAGTLRLSYEAQAMRGILSRVIKAFRKKVPGVKLELFEQVSGEQADALRAGEVDVGVVFLPVDARDLRVWEVDEAPTVVAVPSDHRLADQQRVRLSDLSDEPHVMWARELAPGIHDYYMRTCHEAGFHPQVVQEIRDLESLFGLVEAGLGVSVAHRSTSQLNPPGVSFAILSEPSVPIRTGLARSKGKTGPVTERFLNIARKQFVARTNRDETQ
jgi:DNA-binding transcriptional LysR family regulator